MRDLLACERGLLDGMIFIGTRRFRIGSNLILVLSIMPIICVL